METGRLRIRKDFAPLTVSASLACATNFSPVTQVYNAAESSFEPDRTLSPTVLKPVVTANANDGSWPDPHCNSLLANMHWYANGVDISTLSDWTGKYTIYTDGAERGCLEITRNLLPTERISMQFKAELVDNRLGVTIPVATDPIVLSTVDKSGDSCSMSLDSEKTIYYNPFLDPLFRYEYKVAHGLITASASARSAAAADIHSYLKPVSIRVYKGGSLLSTSDYTVKCFEVANATTFNEISMDFVDNGSYYTTTLDLRLIAKANYMIKAFIEDSEVARIQFSVERDYQPFTCTPTNGTGILPSQTMRYDVAQVNSNGVIVDVPESIIKIVWYTDSSTIKEKQHNEGAETLFELSSTGVGDTYTDDWLDVYTTALQKEPHQIACDENGDTLVDENGETLIFN
jgi:hypothetical protein